MNDDLRALNYGFGEGGHYPLRMDAAVFNEDADKLLRMIPRVVCSHPLPTLSDDALVGGMTGEILERMIFEMVGAEMDLLREEDFVDLMIWTARLGRQRRNARRQRRRRLSQRVGR